MQFYIVFIYLFLVNVSFVRLNVTVNRPNVTGFDSNWDTGGWDKIIFCGNQQDFDQEDSKWGFIYKKYYFETIHALCNGISFALDNLWLWFK